MKNIIKKICDLPVVGEFIALLIGIILPLTPFLLFAKSTGISDEVAMIFGGLAMVGWNLLLKKTDTVNIVTPIFPIPVWTLGLVITLFSLGLVITGNTFS